MINRTKLQVAPKNKGPQVKTQSVSFSLKKGGRGTE